MTNGSLTFARKWRHALCLLVLCCIATHAQSLELSGQVTVPLIFGDAPSPPALPDGDGAWVLQVVTRGGLSGRGKGTVTATSAGTVSCASGPTDACAVPSAPQFIKEIAMRIDGTMPSLWIGSTPSLCSDCYVTMLVLIRREAGSIHMYRSYWNDATRSQAPAGVLAIHDLAVSVLR